MFLGGLLEIDLTPLSGVSQIVIELYGCCSEEIFQLHAGNTIVDSESFDYNNSSQIYTLNNPQNLVVDKLSLVGLELSLISITIYYDCTPACDPKIQVESEQGDVYIDDPCYGAILTSPNGSCFRVKVTDSGALVTEAVTCP